MARKWLSGALAFAMIFGCSAPVALAEETPVEVVEDAALEAVEQDAVEEVEQYALYNPHFEKDTYELTNKVGSKVVLKIEQAPNVKPAKITSDGVDESGWTNFKGSWNSDYTEFTITYAETGLVDGGKHKIVFTYDKTDGDTFNTTEAVTTIKVVAVEKITASLDDGAALNVEAGEKAEFTFKAGDEGSYKKPASVTLKPMTAAAEYVTFTQEDLKDDSGKVIGTKVVATGLKETPKEADLKIKVEVKATDSSATQTYTYPITVTKATAVDAVLSLTAKADKTSITTVDTATIVAQAKKYDAYGDVADYDNAKLSWSVNGQKLEFKDKTAVVKDVLSNPYITVEKTTNHDGIVEVAITKAGTYTFVVSPADNPYMTYPVTITVKEGEKAQTLTLEKTEFSIAPKGSVDLGAQKWKVNGNKTLADFGATLEYTFAPGTDEEKTVAATEDQAKKLGTITNGVLTVVDSDNELLSALFAQKEKAEKVQFKVSVQGKVGDKEFGDPVVLTINIVKAQENALGYVLYVNGEKISTFKIEDGTYVGEQIKPFPALTVGVPATLKVEVVDGNGFSDAVAQDVIFDIEQDNDDPTEYVSFVQTAANEIVITPLVSSVSKASILWTAAANTKLGGVQGLVIMANMNPTATPAPTATVAPTATPAPTATVAPTEKPAERTGVVVNVSSNLNIREEATTSSTVVTKVKNGTELTILGEENGFYKVRLADGKEGYASKQYVRETTPSEPDEYIGTAIVNTTSGALNLRKSAPSGAVITTMPKGASLNVISYGEDYCKVEYKGKVGFAATRYLKVTLDAVG